MALPPCCFGGAAPAVLHGNIFPVPQSPACHTHTGNTLSLADNGESWDKGHMEAGRENMKKQACGQEAGMVPGKAGARGQLVGG